MVNTIPNFANDFFENSVDRYPLYKIVRCSTRKIQTRNKKLINSISFCEKISMNYFYDYTSKTVRQSINSSFCLKFCKGSKLRPSCRPILIDDQNKFVLRN